MFDIPSHACLNEHISLSSNIDAGQTAQWFLCSSYEQAASSEFKFNPSRAFRDCYGFQAVDSTNSILSVRAGGEIWHSVYSDNFQTISSNQLFKTNSGCRSLELLNENDTWSALISQLGNSSNPLLITFNDGFTNTNVNTTSIETGDIVASFGSELVNTNSKYFYFIGSKNSNQVSLLTYNNSIKETPSYSSFSIGSASQITDIELINVCGVWKGLVTSATSQELYLLNFTNGLGDDPDVSLISDNSDLLTRPSGISLFENQGKYFAFVQNDGGNTLRIQFETKLDQSFSIDDLGLITENGFGAATISVHDQKHIFISDIHISTRGLHLLKFEDECTISPSIIEGNTATISYDQPGEYDVTLVVENEFGKSATTKTITVLDQEAPDIQLTSNNSCYTSETLFTPSNTFLSSYFWNFGDNSPSSNEKTPSHTYEYPGTYTVRLDVDDGTCSNFTEQEITIYEEPPVPSFSISGNLCANGEITFTNNTPDASYEGPLEYEWDFAGQGSSNSKDESFIFGSAGMKTVTLKSSIPGCEHITQQVIDLVQGPTSNFMAPSVCQGELLTFTNQSANANSYNWDFGDGFFSSQENASHVFSQSGSFTVSLEAIDSDGCSAVYEQEVSISPLPQANFGYDIPCEGDLGFTFYDQSVVDGADILSWEWSVDGEVVSSEKDPTISFDETGQKEIGIKVISSNGCESMHQESIEILTSPVPAYSVDLVCQGMQSTFLDETPIGENAVSRLWEIDGQTYTDQEVDHVFNESGNFDVNLTVTAANFCSTTLFSTVNVLAAPDVDFTLSSTCVADDIIITDSSIEGDEGIVSRTWQLDGDSFFNGSQASLTSVETGFHDITLHTTTESGCQFSKTETIEFLASPKADFTSSVSYGVPPFQVSFNNSSTDASTYRWLVNGEQVSTSPNLTQSFLETDEYVVELVAVTDEGCEDRHVVEILSAEPAINLIIDRVQLTPQGVAQSISLTVTNQGNLPVEIFDVIISAGADFAVSERINQFLDRGDQTSVTLSSSLQSINSDKVCITIASAYEDVLPDDNEACVSFSPTVLLEDVYPNPVGDELKVKIISPEEQEVLVTISNSVGRTMIRENLSTVHGLNISRYNVSAWKKGLYFVSIQQGDVVVTKKVLKF